jgi:hypothetical protein
MREKIPVWRTIGAAYVDTFRDIGRVLMLAVRPWLLTVIITAAIAFLFAAMERRDHIVQEVLNVLVTAVLNGYFAVAMYRFRLRGWSQEIAAADFNQGTAERYIIGFAMFWALLNLIMPTAILQLAPDFGSFVGYIQFLFFIIVLPFFFALPAAADEIKNPVSFAWKIGKGAWLRILVVLIACFLPPAIALQYLLLPLIDFPLILDLVSSIINFPIAAITITSLSTMYRIRKNELTSGSSGTAANNAE